MYALCVSGAVNTQGFVWKFFMRYIYIFIHSFIRYFPSYGLGGDTYANRCKFSTTPIIVVVYLTKRA